MEKQNSVLFLFLVIFFVYISSAKESRRALLVGDIFTANELLPVAKKLMGKVEEPGRGKGIVSSSLSPGELADKIFEAFFLTDHRIVVLDAHAISGLDALQALALSGEDILVGDNEIVVDLTTYNKGPLIGINKRPTECQYKLLTKKVDSAEQDKVERRALKIAEKLAKKRRIKLNAKGGPRHTNLPRKPINRRGRMVPINNVISTKSYSTTEKGETVVTGAGGGTPKPQLNLTDLTKDSNYKCRWKYVCMDHANIDTCRLRTHCAKGNETDLDDIGFDHNPDEHKPTLQNFRKMIGITLIDEEVEKILQRRVLRIRPRKQNSLNLDDRERVESLKEYFNNIIMHEHLLHKTTPAMNKLPKLNKSAGVRNNNHHHESTSHETPPSVEASAIKESFAKRKSSLPEAKKNIIGGPSIRTTTPFRITE